MRILVAYATAHGSTREVAQFMGRVLSTYNAEVTVANVVDIKSVEGYDVFVLGTPIHASLWLQAMCTFFDRFHDSLANKPMYFWVTCIRALEEDGKKHALQYYFDYKLLEDYQVRECTVFTGKLDTREITRQEQWFLAANYDGKIMPGTIHQDYRDWKAIAAWTNNIALELELKPVFEAEESGDIVSF
jgi:menaquinone-dependent protoporphyrinogen oxidase